MKPKTLVIVAVIVIIVGLSIGFFLQKKEIKISDRSPGITATPTNNPYIKKIETTPKPSQPLTIKNIDNENIILTNGTNESKIPKKTKNLSVFKMVNGKKETAQLSDLRQGQKVVISLNGKSGTELGFEITIQ